MKRETQTQIPAELKAEKIKEVMELTRLHREYRECSITEMWLNERTSDSLVTLNFTAGVCLCSRPGQCHHPQAFHGALRDVWMDEWVGVWEWG